MDEIAVDDHDAGRGHELIVVLGDEGMATGDAATWDVMEQERPTYKTVGGCHGPMPSGYPSVALCSPPECHEGS